MQHQLPLFAPEPNPETHDCAHRRDLILEEGIASLDALSNLLISRGTGMQRMQESLGDEDSVDAALKTGWYFKSEANDHDWRTFAIWQVLLCLAGSTAATVSRRYGLDSMNECVSDAEIFMRYLLCGCVRPQPFANEAALHTFRAIYKWKAYPNRDESVDEQLARRWIARCDAHKSEGHERAE